MTGNVKDYNRATLPKFKDKVMYTSSSGREESYTISSSYKGILRLSPNDNTTIYEEVDNISIPDFSSIETGYTDAIVFDGEASLENLASIERRMLVVSDSDSYAVDLRISKTGVEFKNLNVVGISKFKHVTLYAGDKNVNSYPFKLGNTRMPHLHNEGGDKVRTDGLKYDSKTIDVINEGDNSYFLYSDGSGDERSFVYGKAKPFIENLVLEALLDLQTIPTGSIHFVPVNIDQYKALLGIPVGSSDDTIITNIPNVYKESTDPIVRDFLLCDGRRYNSKDFPELAKILWNENIEYWRSDARVKGTDKTYFLQKSEYTNSFVLAEKDNNGNVTKPDPSGKTFRVPDLRRMFISTISANGISGNEENVVMLKEGDGAPAKNVPGAWLPDNLPRGEDGSDRHFHFMAYGSYTPIVSYGSENGGYGFVKQGRTEFAKVATDESGMCGGLVCMNSDMKPAIMTMTNHLIYCKTGSGPGYGVGVGGLRRRDYWGYEPWPAISYMAGPRTGDNNIKKYEYAEPSIGRTTPSISIMGYGGNTNTSIYGASSDNWLNGEKYVALDENLFGYENAPKFYACLPLIKI